MIVVLLTVRPIVTLKEVFSSQFLIAVAAGEVLRMPGVAQSCYHLSNDRFVAGTTDSLLGRLHSLFVHILLQVPKHGVKVWWDDRFVHLSVRHLEVV